jgi:HlyD family secretion protein
MKLINNRVLLSIPLFLAVIAVGFMLTENFLPGKEYLSGMVETTEIDVASKIPGRIDSLFIEEGSHVNKGDILARLESKEMDAKVEQARGAMEAAHAKLLMVNNGAREEEKKGAMNLYLQAKHQYEFVEKTWNRFQSLYDDEVTSLQERDEMEFKFKAAKEQMEAAKSKYDMALNGARPEEKAAVEALVHQADNVFNEAVAYQQELNLKAPVSGEISRCIVDAGEVVASGYPLLTIMKNKEAYVVLQIREDKMKDIKMGKTFSGMILALGKNNYDFVINYIAPMADFATWKATNQKGDFDLKTFEVHLKPVSPIEDLRPGMTVNVAL